MTRLLARICSPEEATAVAGAGFDGIATDDSALAIDVRLDRLTPAPGADRQVLLLLTIAGGEPRPVSAFADLPDNPDLDRAVSAGAGGILLDPPGRLLDRASVADLARLQASCRARGLLCGCGGDIEPPDVPRLLAIEPDLLILGRVLRLGQRESAGLDRDAVRLLRDLVPAETVAEGREAAAILSPHASAGLAGQPDRIFVRDLVLPVAIGAYDSERGRKQRVRFAVEADLHGTGRPTRDMRDVVSYDLFTDAIHALVANRHVEFVETLAEQIADRVLAHPRVLAVRVTVEKLDVGPGAVGVSIERRTARPDLG